MQIVVKNSVFNVIVWVCDMESVIDVLKLVFYLNLIGLIQVCLVNLV